MKKHSLLISLALIALLPMAAVAQSTATSTPASTSGSRSASWELKGIRLGMSKAEALAAVPQFKCEQSAPGVEACSAAGQTFAGGGAELAIFLLDSKVISVEVRNLGFEQLHAANDALIAKYGVADKRFQIRMPHNLKLEDSLIWAEGNVELSTFPNKSNKSKTPVKVALLDSNRVNLWIARDKAGSVSQSVASDI